MNDYITPHDSRDSRYSASSASASSASAASAPSPSSADEAYEGGSRGNYHRYDGGSRDSGKGRYEGESHYEGKGRYEGGRYDGGAGRYDGGGRYGHKDRYERPNRDAQHRMERSLGRGGGRYADAGPRRRHGDDAELISSLNRLDGRPYGSYKSLLGDWNYGEFTISFDRVQSDPYAPPTALRCLFDIAQAGIPEAAVATKEARLATSDFLLRSFEANIRRFTRPGTVTVVHTAAEILQRSACTITDSKVELRFQVNLPARGRTIMGRTAATIFDRDVPDIILETFDFISEEVGEDNSARLLKHVATYEDYVALQKILAEKNWLAFVADGSILPRRSGISQLPLEGALPFTSPDSVRETVTLPHAGEVSGMVIHPGVTVIAGGGYHGKSTLLLALQRAVYPHVPGDGRELIATTPNAVKLRAGDGRFVCGVDISPFISHLPGGADTSNFNTENASGSSSQAAGIMEAIECGSPLILLDEDTSATNLLIRDERMRALISPDKEPITPLVDLVQAMYKHTGTSCVIVMGGSGTFLDEADRVLMLDNYVCSDVTEQAKKVAAEYPRPRANVEEFAAPTPRVFARLWGHSDRPRTKVLDSHRFILDKKTVDITDLEQVIDRGQTDALSWAVRGISEQEADGRRTIVEILKELEAKLDEEGLDALCAYGARNLPPFMVRPRIVDVAQALNRYRALTLAQPESDEDE